MKSLSKKYTLTNLDFNEVCFLQQSVRARIEYYQFKITARIEVDSKKQIAIYSKAMKDLKRLLKKIDTLKGNTNQKIDVLNKQRAKIEELKKGEDEIPF